MVLPRKYPSARTTTEGAGRAIGRQATWPATTSAVRARVAVVAIDDAATKNGAEDTAEDGAATVTVAGVGTAAVTTVPTLAAIGHRGHR